MNGPAADTAAADTAAAADAAAMLRALELAARGLYTTDPNPRVGCVLVRAGAVIGEGWHARAGGAHAEVMALRAAGDARGATAYVTLEPCSHIGRTPPCADALIAAGVVRVVCATGDPNPKVAGGGLARLRDAGIEVFTGLHATAARDLNAGFFSRFERRRPLVRLKLAMSLDARTTPAAGGQRWITGAAARADVQTWRARSSAVLTGAGTVRVDDPHLDVRLAYGPWVRQPLRVVLDPHLRCQPESRVFSGGPALVFAAAPPATDTTDTTDVMAMTDATLMTPGPPTAGVPVVRVPFAHGRLDLKAVLGHLTALECNELWIECGPRLAASFLREEFVDELILYVAPTFLGADAAPLTAMTGLDSNSLRRFEFRDQRLIDGDLRLVLTPKRD